eukprot:TRINITY_DN8264_c0_g1_i1.p1 TRINITY_DN8264_c0_g1~~TRINITY_DN8264_c0_g1_i1.p1  ORF type:complete len:295 (+),score=19.02 TRINITY_DN8264_c0_g1_i1:71-955(+)
MMYLYLSCLSVVIFTALGSGPPVADLECCEAATSRAKVISGHFFLRDDFICREPDASGFRCNTRTECLCNCPTLTRYYPFEGSYSSSVGPANALQKSSNAAISSDVSYRGTRSIIRDEFDDASKITTPVDFSSPTAAVTVGVWMYPNTAFNKDRMVFWPVDSYNSYLTTEVPYRVYISAADKPCAAANAAVGNPLYSACGPDPIPLSTWTHLQWRHDATAGLFDLRINGTVVAEGSFPPGSAMTTPAGSYLGIMQGPYDSGQKRHIGGYFDELRVWEGGRTIGPCDDYIWSVSQ